MNIYYGDLPDMKYEVPLLKYFDEKSPFKNPQIKYVPPQKKEFNLINLLLKKENVKHDIIDDDSNLDIIPNSYKNEVIDTYNDPDFYEQNDNENSNVKKRYYLIVGEAFGNIRIIDFYGFIKKINMKYHRKLPINQHLIY